MCNYEIKPDIEQKNSCEKALKALLEADKSVNALTDSEKQYVLQQYLQLKGLGNLYNELRNFFG